jgi:GTP-binding protein
MALKSLERSQVAALVLDASEGVTAQDAHIAGYAHEAGRALVVVVNKWDLVPPGTVQKTDVVGQIYDRLSFIDYAPVCFTSAARAEGLRELFDLVDRVAAEATRRVDARELLSVLRQAVARRPLAVGGAPLLVHSAAQVGVSPPTFAVRVSAGGAIHFSYQRYLVNSLRHAYGFSGSPVRLLFRRTAGRRPRRPARPDARRSR